MNEDLISEAKRNASIKPFMDPKEQILPLVLGYINYYEHNEEDELNWYRKYFPQIDTNYCIKVLNEVINDKDQVIIVSEPEKEYFQKRIDLLKKLSNQN